MAKPRNYNLVDGTALRLWHASKGGQLRGMQPMAKPRNYHALNAIQRKAGYHSGKKRPHMSECDDVLERLDYEENCNCDACDGGNRPCAPSCCTVPWP